MKPGTRREGWRERRETDAAQKHRCSLLEVPQHPQPASSFLLASYFYIEAIKMLPIYSKFTVASLRLTKSSSCDSLSRASTGEPPGWPLHAVAPTQFWNVLKGGSKLDCCGSTRGQEGTVANVAIPGPRYEMLSAHRASLISMQLEIEKVEAEGGLRAPAVCPPSVLID